MNNKELFHSDIYLGEDYSDGIRHWKYVKREKLSNGKYRYYYKDDELDKTYSDWENTIVDRSKAYSDKWNKELAYDRAKSNRESAESNFRKNTTVENGKKYSNSTADEKKKYNEYEQALINYDVIDKKAMTLAKKYDKMKLAHTPQRVIAKGIAAVANLLENVKSKFKK